MSVIAMFHQQAATTARIGLPNSICFQRLSRVGRWVNGDELLNSFHVRKLQVHCGVVKRRGFPSASGHGACGKQSGTGAMAHVNTSHPCQRFLG